MGEINIPQAESQSGDLIQENLEQLKQPEFDLRFL